MSDSAPITRQDLDTALDKLKSEIVAAISASEERTTEQMRDTETKLLRAFHGWARPAEIRIRDQATLAHGFDERLALLEERVSHLERKEPAA